jgi:hypothetical protein
LRANSASFQPRAAGASTSSKGARPFSPQNRTWK